jgi:hypothetical protein
VIGEWADLMISKEAIMTYFEALGIRLERRRKTMEHLNESRWQLGRYRSGCLPNTNLGRDHYNNVLNKELETRCLITN